MHVLDEGIHRLVGCWRDASFNVFVDNAPGPDKWVLSFCCIDERFVVEVPHNHEVTTNVTWDLQLMRDTPIQLPILVSNNPHLLVQSCTPLQHADECLVNGSTCLLFASGLV